MARRERQQRPGQVRCAIYTRKSTEEGLEQDFNSLDAQREACEAFIRSQRSEGWKLIPDLYDDGGISGGTLERPALQRLLADIENGRIDIVVVYKIDRLTRSLADFAKLVEVFDGSGASFVSVTQQFNTSTSMGRLTLNMLLSFAQFEREVTAERIRDKIAASKRKGMWMGGPVPLGYDAIDKKLEINEAEAATVRRIYELYLALGSIRHVKAELDRGGIVSKIRTTKAGERIGGRPFTRGALALILQNPIYIGEIQHDGERHAGLHSPIIDRETWEAAQANIGEQRVARRIRKNAANLSPLAGMLFDDKGEPFQPGHASKGPARIRYRYYISKQLETGLAADHSGAWRLPAEPIERAVRQALIDLLNTRDQMRFLGKATGSASETERIHQRRYALIDRLETAAPASLREMFLEFDARIEIGPEAITVSISRDALARSIGADLETAHSDTSLSITRPILLRKRGVETKLILGGVEQSNPDPALIQLVADARTWMQYLRNGDYQSIRALARDLGQDHRHVARSLPLAFLAPDVVAAVLQGRQPPDLTVTTLKRFDALPIRWDEQRTALEMLASA